ncbi:MAG: HK97 family phage prohead protease [Clostridium paraputrificum]
MNKEKELRYIDKFEVREVNEGDDQLELEGYIAKFNIETELWNGYFEKIDRKAFDETLSDGHNIFLVYHHDMSKVLASTRNNTLALETDDIGLKFRATINKKLSYAKDVYELVKSGECRGCSFGFYTLKDEVLYNSETDELHRTLLKVEMLEGTITPIPAYENTNVSARAKEIKEEEKNKINRSKELQELIKFVELQEIENELI